MSSTPLASHLEGRPNVLDGRRLGREVDADHVEARVAVRPSACGEEVLRHPRHLLLLAGRDGLESRPRSLAAAAAYLDEHQISSVQGHQVDLSGTTAEIAGHDLEVPRAEKRLRHVLTSPPELPPPFHARELSGAPARPQETRLHTLCPPHSTLDVPPYFTNRLGPPDCSVVVPELVVGAYLEPHDLPWLATEREIRAVLNLQDDFDLAAKRLSLADLRRACSDVAVAFDRVPVADGDHETLARRLPDLVALLDRLVREHGRVYLHCNAGMNRAPTVAIAYLHVHHDLGLQAAVALMKSRRSCLPYVTALKAAYPHRASLRVPKP